MRLQMKKIRERSTFGRRDFLKAGALGLGSLTLGESLVTTIRAGDEPRVPKVYFKDHDKIVARLRGCFTPLPTLYQGDDLDVNLQGMRRHVRFLLEGGIRQGNGVLLVSGAAGDFTALSVEERLQIAEAVLNEAAGKVGVILGAQSANQREVLALARGAAKLGATAIQVSPPFYQTYTDDDVVAFYKTIAESAAIGIIVYYTHWQYKLSLDTLSRLIDLPGVVGLKWAAPSAYEYNKGLRLFAKRTGVIDNQLQFVQSHMMGACGIDTHPVNYWPEWGVQLWGLLEAGRYKEAEQSINKVVMPFYDLLEEISQFTGSEGNLDKLCLELVGVASSGVRPPVRDFRDKFRDKARQMLKACGVPRCQ
jgi:dihydrodipicolinate synthase/N-acetylneuraminate lyase